MIDSKENKSIQKKMDALIKDLSKDLYEREETIAITVLSAIAGQSIFLYGPPGTAKSLIARRTACAFKDSNYFEYLMQRFSTPEDVFGPVSISELKKDNYIRKTDHYLPTADIAFLDEIWKSSPAILNTLLTIINERKFKNGNEVENVPLKALIAASNEFPQENTGLDALYDRFIMRLKVVPLEDRENFEKMISKGIVDDIVTSSNFFSNEEWLRVIQKSENVTVSKEVLEIINHIKILIEDSNKESKKDANAKEIYVSDRKWQKSVQILKVAAYLNGRSSVTPVDALLLRHSLWSSEENLEPIQKMVEESVSSMSKISGNDLKKWEQNFTNFEDEIQKTFFHSESIYETVKIGDKNCYPIKLMIEYTASYPYNATTQKKEFTIYVPEKYIKTNNKFNPLQKNGAEDKMFECNFNSSEIVTILIDARAKNTIGSSNDPRVYCSGKYEMLEQRTPTIKIKSGSQKPVPTRIKETYLNGIKDIKTHIDDMIKNAEKYVKEQKQEIYSPFVPEDKRELILVAMQKHIDNLKNHQINTEHLHKKVNSCEIN